ncbi:hypothetical protein ASF58_19450 [Methylobacterium sp. Leaf125]|jgi:hypothetical protein|uniref:hypothetical protein n=1 Tax=unclassified Methylobacterium TaxID=2615210 RepID=UPI0006FF195F|nr:MULTISPECIES: hypothetical protein [unclassified Methylobacterium]KQQ45212.1 hypothetical protein ASF58_19450 [Methylobacterium sp. Leaf125]POR42611.1 hypothetical protein CRT23_12555 [Methylobacterium sp. V23]RZK90161.1 MAG: hypothetical protein EOO66_14540 [Methylobacterium sp.]
MADHQKTPETDIISTTGQAAPKGSDRNRPENQKGELDERLDEALEETFPSSDPVSVKITK